MTYDGPWMINDAAKDNPYQYNGKELNLDHGLNWSDYGARWYDACLGRWSSVDPLAESAMGWTPYRYGFNNPLSYTDPNGMLESSNKSFNDMSRLFSTDTNNENNRGSDNNSSEATNSDGNPVINAIRSFYKNVLDKLGFDNQDRPSMEDTGEFLEKKSQQLQEVVNFMELIPGVQAINYNNSTSERSLAFALLLFPIEQPAKVGTTTIFRVVSKGEAADILVNGFRQAPIGSKIASYEGKLFWTNMKDAKWYHNWVGDGNQIVKIKVSNSFIFENGADVGRQFYYVSKERMQLFNNAVKSVK